VTVELEVGLRGFVVPVGFDSIVERGEASLQLREFRFAHSPGGFERGLDLQDRAQVYALADLLHGEARDHRTDVRSPRHQPGVLKALQRLTDGRLADRQLPRERQFTQRNPGRVAAFENALTEPQNDGVDAGGGGFRGCHDARISRDPIDRTGYRLYYR